MEQRIRENAIILRRKPFGEADLLLTLLTSQHGKMRVIARGARKTSSRLVGHTEPFSVVSCQVNLGPTIPIISQVTVEHSIAGLAEDGGALQRISLLAEVVDRALEEGVASESIYHLMVEGSLRIRYDFQPMLFVGLMIRLLGLLGYAPELNHCILCKTRLQVGTRYGWDHEGGGIVADTCLKNHSLMSEGAVKALRYLQRQPITHMGRLQPVEDVIDELHNIIINYARYVLEHPIISATVSYTDEYLVRN